MGGKLSEGGDGKGRNGKQPPKEHRWKPGVSPNPGGAPKGKRVSTWMLELGNMSEADLEAYLVKEFGSDNERNLPMNARLALRCIRDGMAEGAKNANGALDTYQDRTEGKVAQVHKMAGGNPHTGHELGQLAQMVQRLAEAKAAKAAKK
jgi:hypothetical protein